MKWITLPTGEDKPAWAGLFAAVSMLFVFVDPYQRGAPLIEWMWTGLAFAIFLALCTVGLIYWSRRHVVLRVVIAKDYNRALARPLFNCPACFERKEAQKPYRQAPATKEAAAGRASGTPGETRT